MGLLRALFTLASPKRGRWCAFHDPALREILSRCEKLSRPYNQLFEYLVATSSAVLAYMFGMDRERPHRPLQLTGLNQAQIHSCYDCLLALFGHMVCLKYPHLRGDLHRSLFEISANHPFTDKLLTSFEKQTKVDFMNLAVQVWDEWKDTLQVVDDDMRTFVSFNFMCLGMLREGMSRIDQLVIGKI